MFTRTPTLINSQSRNGGSSSDFTITLSERKAIKGWQIEWVTIPLTIYNISTNNNVISFTENSVLKTATIPVGTYTGDTLADAVETAMNTASATYNVFEVEYDHTTYKVTFSVPTTNNPFRLDCSANLFPYSELGFSKVNTASSTTIRSPSPVSLSKPHAIVVSIPELDNTILTGTYGIHGSCVIPVGLNLGRTLHYEPENKIINTLNNTKNVSTISVKLLDLDNNKIDLNGSDWTLNITLFE
jgi:hypothetical protein